MIKYKTAFPALFCIISLLSGCMSQSPEIGGGTGSIAGQSSEAEIISQQETAKQPLSDFAGYPLKSICENSVKTTLNDNSNKKICYGQGREVDNLNRPVGATDAQAQYGSLGALFIGDENDKTVYLTFDEGYENGYTEDILNILKEKKVTATFYVTMDYVKRNPELIKRMINEGHEVGNHTSNHPSLPDCTNEQVSEEIKSLEQYICNNFGGYKTTTLRPPKGEFSVNTLNAAKKMGYKTVLWSFAYSDWDTKNQPDKTQALNRIKEATHNGAIYLLHAVSKTNAEILGDVIDYWKEQGMEVKSIDN